ncbi:MAG: CRISPR-associated helicase/endonuclease Cas3 [Thermomicrobiales bacterium]|nr:MAG: CRISPR-associated helicase/endonuclease Cas3 [Thermomicrobiales bacterium]
MMRWTRLLAKSSKTPDAPREAETLAGHTVAVVQVSEVLARQWGERYLEGLGLEPGTYLPLLQLVLPRAAAVHDLGKANDHFQRRVRRDPTLVAQAGYHEQISAWVMLTNPAFGPWLCAGLDEVLRHVLVAAVIGHHLRLDDGQKLRLETTAGTTRMHVLAGHPDVRAALEGIGSLLGLASPPMLSDVELDVIDAEEMYEQPLRLWLRNAERWHRGATEDERRFLACVKALVIAADVAGSALPRLGEAAERWAMRALGRVCTADLMDQVIRRRLGEAKPRPFQIQVKTSEARVTFVRAGCGTGKTAAAYLWAGQRAVGRKLFVCYPTTGTASQGYEDYVPPDEFEAALVHSRALADLNEFLVTGEEDGGGQGRAWIEELVRLQGLALWDAPVTVCTVDTVLGLIQNNRVGVFGFPAIGNGAFVFDEIHQYDDMLFESLLRFLTAFRGVPMLLMTASLPAARLQALKDALARSGEELRIVDGPEDLETLKRYRLQTEAEDEAWARVREAIAAGQRVLWVVNTVDRAIVLAQHAEAIGLPAEPYHSRYRYQDRLVRHRRVVSLFSGGAGEAALAITTQVCEVSLDISADLLVTELAPIPALIQRLGRLMRRVTPGEAERIGRALVLEPGRPEPYREEDLAVARAWLQRLGDGPLSQADLAAAFEQVAGDGSLPRSIRQSAWLDGGPLAWKGALREEGTTIPVIREEDVAEMGAGLDAVRVIRLTVPMPVGPVAREIGRWKRLNGAFVAPAGRVVYDERLGGRWR